MARQVEAFKVEGGLNEVRPAISMPPGFAVNAINYEPWINGGYRRMLGYERFDGRTAPSSAVYYSFFLDDASSYAVDDPITGDTSGATGIVCAKSDNEIAVTAVTGDFEKNETVDTATATITTTPALQGASTFELDRTFQLAAEDYYRALIDVVPGTGDVLGAWQIRDRAYAVRNDGTGTIAVIHKASASGWTTTGITMGTYIYFTLGSVALAEGDSINGQTSGATADIHRVIIHSGSWGGGDAKGYLVIKNITGTWQLAENIRITTTVHAVSDSVATEFELNPGGRCDWRSYNFLGGSATYRAYCADGVNPAFEIDENDFVSPILLDTSLDDSPANNTPFLVEAHQGYLWLAFDGGIVAKSVVGEPLVYNGFFGAAQYGLGEEVTSLISLDGDVLIAATLRQTFAFYTGSTAGTYEKRLIADRAGAVLYSSQQVGSLYYQDSSGVVELSRADVYGDFANATVSDLVQPTVTRQRSNIVGSYKVRASNQFRLMYKNGEGMIGRVRPDGIVEFMPLNYLVDVYFCNTCEDEDEADEEVIFFGGSNGFVYQAEKGRSFDGGDILSFCRMAFNHCGSPAVNKRFYKVMIEVEGQKEIVIRLAYDFSYGDTSLHESATVAKDSALTVFGGGSAFDDDIFDEVFFDAPLVSRAETTMTGVGTNVSLLVLNETATTDSFILQGFQLQYADRRFQR